MISGYLSLCNDDLEYILHIFIHCTCVMRAVNWGRLAWKPVIIIIVVVVADVN